MENVAEEKVDIEDELLDEPDFTQEELEDETTDWKAKAQELKGLNKRRASKLKKAKEALSKKPESETKPNPEKPEKKGFDYAEKAYLKSSGIKSDEFDFVYEASKDSGKPIDELLESPWFQKALEEKREDQTTKDAIPSSTKRTATPASDTVDYWIQKGGLPEDSELASKVVKERRRRAESGSMFSDNPVV